MHRMFERTQVRSRRSAKTGRHRRALGLCAPLAFSLLAATAEVSGFELVTEAEHMMALEAPDEVEGLVPKSVPGAPAIELMSPAVEGDSIASPIDIEVRFQPVGGATIDMASLKIFYLMLIRKDVTSRILEHAEVGDGVLRASGAELPAGKHRFLLEITDSEQRTATRRFSVTVGS